MTRQYLDDSEFSNEWNNACRTVAALVVPVIGVECHRGIRFAEPPTGERRWRPPCYVGDAVPLDVWGPDCPQPGSIYASRAPYNDEDCLFLNVWTPTRDPDARLPVLVWFPGGSFLFGSGSDPITDGAALAARGAVVVAANYRLGLLGYLAHPALTAESPHNTSGNYGLLDNLAALRWVADNIERYGGDPERITAFGVSAGSAALALLQTSPLASGRFDRLILQSPGAWRPLASLSDAEDGAVEAYGDDLDRMRAWSPQQVLQQALAMIPRVRGLTAPRLMRPIRDGWVVPEDERAAYRAGRFAPVPTIVGSNGDEGTKLTATWPIVTVEEYRRFIHANFGQHSAEALRYYPVNRERDVAPALAAVFGDTQFSYGVWGIATEVARRQPDTYRYVYGHRTRDRRRGPDHGDEVAPLFAGSSKTGAAMADAWVRFAATGDPNGGDLPQWDRYDPASDNHLVFDDPMSEGRRWRASSLRFLDQYYDSVADEAATPVA